MRDFSSMRNARNNITKNNIRQTERYMKKQDRYYRKHMKNNVDNVKKIVPKIDTTYEVSNETVPTNKFRQLFNVVFIDSFCIFYYHLWLQILIVKFLDIVFNIMFDFFDVDIDYNSQIAIMLNLKHKNEVILFVTCWITILILYLHCLYYLYNLYKFCRYWDIVN